MQGPHDTDQTTTSADGDDLDPREAARLLAHTEREARRRFNLNPPWIVAVSAAVILVAYGALWLSTHGQRPYKARASAWSRWSTRRWQSRSPRR
jgi:hypothetical protein